MVGTILAISVMCLVLSLRLTQLARSACLRETISQELAEVQATASKARASAITAQARIEAIGQDSEGIKTSADSLREVHAQIKRDIAQALELKMELAVFVEHGNKVIDRLDSLINGMGGKR